MTHLATALKRQRSTSWPPMKQADLAERIGCSQQLVGKWETGKATPGAKYIQPLADFLGVTEGEVLRLAFSGEEDPDEIRQILAAQGETISRLEAGMAQVRDILGLLAGEN